MAADSDGSLTAVVICEGNLHDPEFPRKFRHLLAKLKHILQQPKKSKKLKVNKVEPWNSVRVTLSIPKDAAAKLRQLASEGSSTLRALGILSVQLEGDTVISLRLVGQDLVLRTDNTNAGCVQEAAGSSNTALNDLSQILCSRIQQTTAGPSSCSSPQTLAATSTPNISEPIPGPSNRNIIPQANLVPGNAGAVGNNNSGGGSISNPVVMNGPTVGFDKNPIFKSPNTVCPMGGKLPIPPLTNIVETREYPFESMTQARVIQRRENTMAVVAALGAGSQTTVTGTNVPSTLGQGKPITPAPLTIPVTSATVETVAQQPQQGQVKSPFMQPPPPPYPNAPGTNHMKGASHTVQHSNPIALSNSTNALSSPLLVNLLQNDGVSQVKVSSGPSSVMLQQPQPPPSATIVSNATKHTQNDGVLLLNSNSNDSSSNISISPSIPVPSSSQTISNISNNSVGTLPVIAATNAVINQNILVGSHQAGSVQGATAGIRIQQQRFSIPQTPQQQQSHILPQHQIIHAGASGVQIQRFQSQQNQIIGGVRSITGIHQQTFRHPQQQQIPIHQPYTSPSPSPNPNLLNHPQQQQHQPQQLVPNSFNHPRWPFKPMDSATKSSFQEFARYQLQYNLQQEMNSQSITASATQPMEAAVIAENMGHSSASSGDKSGITDALGLSGYLDELTKNDLDSLLLPGLNDLDSTLDLDGKNALESLLDAKDLDLDLIDHDGAPAVLSATVSNQVGPLNVALHSSAIERSAIAPPPHSTIQSQTQKLSATRENATSNSSTTCPSSNAFSNKGQNLTSTGKERQYLINPLTGELEPMPSDEESDSEKSPPTNIEIFNEFNSEISNSLYSDDDNSCSTAFSKASDHSDTERSSNSEASGRSKYSKSKKERKDTTGGTVSYSNKKSKQSHKNNSSLREKLQQGIKDKISGKSKQPREKLMTKAKLIPNDGKDSPSEKIKLRLKLEKSEPVAPAYKVDISFVPSPKRAQTTINSTNSSFSNYSSSSQSSLSLTPNSSPNVNQQQVTLQTSSTSHNASNQSPHGEEPRVPPLHISLRGKNSIVIKNSKKDRKKSQSGGEEDESHVKKAQLKRNNNIFDEQTIVNRYVIANDHVHFVNSKPGCQGKPISRPSSHDEYPVSNNYSKPLLENGEEAVKGFHSSKRLVSDVVVSPNGLVCPESKRRRMSQSLDQQQHQGNSMADDKKSMEPYSHLQGPIGSTNVGTLPTHLSLAKNQKSSNNNNNNSSNFINKLHKGSIKSGKPLVVVRQIKSPNNNAVKDPGKSPPVLVGLEQSQIQSSTLPLPSTTTTVHMSMNSSNSVTMASKSQSDSPHGVTAASQSKISNKQSAVMCLLPQGSPDAISKEKFKQKLLEFHGSEIKESLEKTANISENANNDIQTEVDVKLKAQNESTSSLLPTRLLDEKSQNSSKLTAHPTSTVMSSSSTNLVDILSDQPLEKNESKEQSAIQGLQSRPTNQSQNAGSTDVGINLLNNGNGNSNVRNSPGSQAQGEDSGIESMDALSEKSPHQSGSPQQGDTQSSQLQQKRNVEIVHKMEEKISLDTKDDPEEEITSISDIEAALAKMEGINDHFLTPCENPMHKLNGEHTMKEESLLENLTDEKIILCTTKLEQEEDLAAIMGGGNSGKCSPVLSTLPDVKVECRDLNENKEISSKISLATQLIDECCKKSFKPNTKLEDDLKESTRSSLPRSLKEKKFEENVIQITSSSNEIEVESVAESIKSELPVVKDEPTIVDPSVSVSVSMSSQLSCDVISESNDKSAINIKEILTPITIEIPTNAESEIPRVRTRASSKLESPLDAPKQSPQLDSPATIAANSLSQKSNLRLSATVIDRLSPKVQCTGKGAGGVLAGTKRKRQGSESSTHSCVSDDTPGRNNSTNGPTTVKRTRPNSSSSSTTHGSNENLSSMTTKCSSANTNTKRPANKLKKTADESSDSDEPLIEVAGKVRGCKGATGKNSSSESLDNKILRNHRAPSQHSRAHSTSSSTSSNTSHYSVGHSSSTAKTIRGANTSHSNSTIPATVMVTIASSNSSNQIQNNTHCTRANSGSVGGSSTGTTAVSANNSSSNVSATTAPNSTHPLGTQGVHDDKIGTRRSVRASAAANKIIYARSGGTAHNSNNESNKMVASALKNAHSGTVGTEAGSAEQRRKTRSAAGGETSEGRRRRGSRDSK